MTDIQKQLLATFARKNITAIFAAGQWVWRRDIRDDADLAARVAAELGPEA